MIYRYVLAGIKGTIENYHRTIKEVCCIENCPVRKRIAQKNYINCSLRAYVRVEVDHSKNGSHPLQIKWEIQKMGISQFLREKSAQ